MYTATTRLKRLAYPTVAAPKDIGTDQEGHPIPWTSGTLGDLDLMEALVSVSGEGSGRGPRPQGGPSECQGRGRVQGSGGGCVAGVGRGEGRWRYTYSSCDSQEAAI